MASAGKKGVEAEHENKQPRFQKKKKIVDKGNFTGAGQDVCVLILLPDKTASFG